MASSDFQPTTQPTSPSTTDLLLTLLVVPTHQSLCQLVHCLRCCWCDTLTFNASAFCRSRYRCQPVHWCWRCQRFHAIGVPTTPSTLASAASPPSLVVMVQHCRVCRHCSQHNYHLWLQQRHLHLRTGYFPLFHLCGAGNDTSHRWIL